MLEVGMSTVGRLANSFRRPEYTGENRCLPCTTVNVSIAALLSVGVSLVSVGAGVSVALVSGFLIYFRGYLVPGTPTLTKRYFPPWLLARFDGGHREPVGATSLDGEGLLIATGAVVEDGTVDDLVLDPAFEAAWRARIDEIGSVNAALEELAEVIDADVASLETQSQGNALVVRGKGRVVGQWESRGAFLADLAASGELERRYDGWDELQIGQQSQALGLLRLFLETCPTCDGEIEFGQEAVESCCRSIDVIAATCRDCNDRLFESQFDPAVISGPDEPG